MRKVQRANYCNKEDEEIERVNLILICNILKVVKNEKIYKI